jgi:hypothetical protein
MSNRGPPSSAPPRAACLAFPSCHRFHLDLDLDKPQPVAYTTPSNQPGADNDANNDVLTEITTGDDLASIGSQVPNRVKVCRKVSIGAIYHASAV